MLGFGKKENPDPKTGVDYEKLGRDLEGVLIRDYINLLGSPRQQITRAFVRGIFTGLGTIIGATVVLSLIIWILTQLIGVPVIGQYFEDLGRQLDQGTR